MSARTFRPGTAVLAANIDICSIAIELTIEGDSASEIEPDLARYPTTTKTPDYRFALSLYPQLPEEENFRREYLQVGLRDDLLIIDRIDVRATFDSRSRRLSGRIITHPHSLDSLIKIWSALVLPQHDLFFLHGVGLRVQDRGFLFLGRSGKGKSTLAQLTPGDGVYSDEWCCLTIVDGGLWMIPSPIRGWDSGIAYEPLEPVPLVAVGVLSQAPQTSFQPFDPPRRLSQALGHVPLFGRIAGVTEHIFGQFARCFPSILMGQLDLSRGDRPWEAITPYLPEHFGK